MKRQITPAQMRKELNAMGYSVRTRRGTEFITAKVMKDGKQINGANVITPEFLDEHKAYFDWAQGVSIIEDGWRTIL